MTDQADLLTGPSFVAPGSDRARAFKAASRHSARVRLLRAATIGGAALLLCGIVLFTVIDPFHPTLAGVSIDGASLDGTKVTMANPRLSGYHKDGRPYTITAASAVQDIKAPTLFELHDLKAQLTQADRTVTRVTAATGLYNSTEETMHLTSAVRILGDDGLDVHAQDARVTFKTNAVATDKPVTVAMHGNTVDADSMQVVDGGQHVTFEGHVHSVMKPAEATADASLPQAAP